MTSKLLVEKHLEELESVKKSQEKEVMVLEKQIEASEENTRVYREKLTYSYYRLNRVLEYIQIQNIHLEELKKRHEQ